MWTQLYSPGGVEGQTISFRSLSSTTAATSIPNNYCQKAPLHVALYLARFLSVTHTINTNSKPVGGRKMLAFLRNHQTSVPFQLQTFITLFLLYSGRVYVSSQNSPRNACVALVVGQIIAGMLCGTPCWHKALNLVP